VCNLFLDGIELDSCSFLPPSEITRGGYRWDDSHTDWKNKTKHHYYFGKLQLTGEILAQKVRCDFWNLCFLFSDNEEIAPLVDARQARLNTIKVKLRWVHMKRITDTDSEDSDSNSEDNEDIPNVGIRKGAPKKLFVHEQVASKGHGGSAELGPLVLIIPEVREKGKKKRVKDKEILLGLGGYQEDAPLLCFSIRTQRWAVSCSRRSFVEIGTEWFQDREIMPQPAPLPASESLHPPSQVAETNSQPDIPVPDIPPPSERVKEEPEPVTLTGFDVENPEDDGVLIVLKEPVVIKVCGLAYHGFNWFIGIVRRSPRRHTIWT
jgi:hypothetical protein